MPAACKLEWADYDDGHVLYEYASGTTMLVDDVAYSLIQLLCESDRAVALDEFLSRLSEQLGFEPDQEFHQHISQALVTFRQHGLVDVVDL